MEPHGVGVGSTVEIVTPPAARDGGGGHTVVEIDTLDRPFVVDSVTALLGRRGFEVHRVAERVDDGRLHVGAEIDRETNLGVLSRLRVEVEDVLLDVAFAVDDWPAMLDRVRALAHELRRAGPPSVDAADVAEAATFLDWLADDHFTFVASCEYEIRGRGDDAALVPVAGSELGVARRRPLSDPGGRGTSLLAPYVLTLTTAPEASTVHRRVPLDDVRVRRFDSSGAAIAETRFVGLYTASVYHDSVERIPVIRRKAAAVLASAAEPRTRGSHGVRALEHVLETLPREELFRLPTDQLTALVHGVTDVGERRRVRLFANPDELGRFVSCLVFLPRDRYTTPVREAIVDRLRDTYAARSADYSVLVGDSVMARLHIVLTEPARSNVDVPALEAQLVEVTRAWVDELRDALQRTRGEEEGLDTFRRFEAAFPAGYQGDVAPAEAVDDIAVLERLDPAGDLAIRLRGDVRRRPESGDDRDAHLVLYRSGTPLVLSDVMPVLEQLDVVVVDERPYEIRQGAPGDGSEPTHWIYSFGVRAVSDVALDDPDLQSRVAELFQCVWSGVMENDGLNRLVVAAGLAPRDVVILRALAKYLHQAGVVFTDATLAAALVRNPAPTREVLELFHARLDPADDTAPDEIDVALGRSIDAVASLDDDRLLRALAALVRAVVRTNAFLDRAVVDDRLAMKLDPEALDFLPRPRPDHEIWVYSPRIEGVHLRGGDVARGGIRWSDRRDDFRTEVLGLMKAQTAKNAVIVPVGAKGGFVVKQGEVLDAYCSFIRGLLDLTDNLVDGAVVPPPGGAGPEPRMRVLDGDDPYLVVAADKGTASFSDVANEIAAEYDFWLGDAFASGGSTGYDHKAMGITSRGVWISVRSHFRTMGVDADTAPLSVVGIGDMSGDVFGNGMLRSPHLRLVAAFDHRHVFVDPEPDPATAFGERRRLFGQERSSWADYDPALISPGGGVYPRDAKSIDLSPEARRVLGLSDDRRSATPAEVISAILCAPVDLLWNGGIGTFVKATHESNDAVGDRVNDAVRVDAGALRCRVIAEGGNLGLTQAARVEYALAGGRVYSDAIDNSAGVDCSDHEVNIKILLREAIRDGSLAPEERDGLLAELTDEVAALVLADNEAQANALEIASLEASQLLSVHARLIERLERAGVVDRRLEGLPDTKQLQERAASGRGLTTPELAVLLAFTKLELQRHLVASEVPDDPYLERDLLAYFPSALRTRFADAARRHPLRREIIATVVANAVVNRAGISFLSRLVDELGAALPELARAHVVAWDVFGSAQVWSAVDTLDLSVAPATQGRMFLAERRLVERAARWFTRRDGLASIGPAVERYRAPVEAVLARLPDLLAPGAAAVVEEATGALVAEGVPPALAARIAGADAALGALTAADLADEHHLPVEVVAAVHFRVAARLGLDWLRDRIAALPRADRWQTEARAALRDDLTDAHRELTDAVLTAAAVTSEADADRAVDAWTDAHRDDLARYTRVVDEVRAGDVYDLAQLTAARRALRDLTLPA